MDGMTKHVVGLFDDRGAAERAVSELQARGFDRDRISIAMRDQEDQRRMSEDTGTSQTAEAAGTGAIGGGILGGLAGLLVGVGALTIPGVGPILAAGPLAGAIGTTLAGAGIGAAAGGLVGALVGMGVPEEEAEYYAEGVRRGGVLVTVQSDDARADDATRIMQRAGALDVDSERRRSSWGRLSDGGTAVRDDRTRTSGMREDEHEHTHSHPGGERHTHAHSTGHHDEGRSSNSMRGQGDTDSVELREERLTADKERVRAGEVHVGKEVVSQEQTLDVPVTREEVVVERHPVEGRQSSGPITGEGRTIDVPVHEERVDVEKQTRVYEEVDVGKRSTQETQRVSDTVRREEARIDATGDVNVRGGGEGGRWDDEMPRFRDAWNRDRRGGSERWEDHEPSYRYGWESAHRPEYRGRSWSEAEPDLRRDWESRNPDTPWERAASGIRDAWNRATGDTRSTRR